MSMNEWLVDKILIFYIIYHTIYLLKTEYILGFPGGAGVKNLPANAGDKGSSPGLGRSHMSWSN